MHAFPLLNLQDWTCTKNIAMAVKVCERNKATVPPHEYGARFIRVSPTIPWPPPLLIRASFSTLKIASYYMPQHFTDNFVGDAIPMTEAPTGLREAIQRE
jgi:hypothetical protein